MPLSFSLFKLDSPSIWTPSRRARKFNFFKRNLKGTQMGKIGGRVSGFGGQGSARLGSARLGLSKIGRNRVSRFHFRYSN